MVKKKTESNEHSTQSSRVSIVAQWNNSVGNKPKYPLPDEFFEPLIKEMYAYVSDSNVIFLRPFFRDRRVDDSTTGVWCKKNKKFAQAFADCMEIIAERRETAAAGWGNKGQPLLHPAVHMKTAHLYDIRLKKQWQEEQTFLTDEKIRAAQKAGIGVGLSEEDRKKFSNPTPIGLDNE